jgi:hypothetical protein
VKRDYVAHRAPAERAPSCTVPTLDRVDAAFVDIVLGDQDWLRVSSRRSSPPTSLDRGGRSVTVGPPAVPGRDAVPVNCSLRPGCSTRMLLVRQCGSVFPGPLRGTGTRRKLITENARRVIIGDTHGKPVRQRQPAVNPAGEYDAAAARTGSRLMTQ